LRGGAGFFAVAAGRLAADFFPAFLAAAFFEPLAVAGCFLGVRLTAFFAVFLVFFGGRDFVVAVALTLFLTVLLALGFLLRFFATDARPVAARDLRALLARDFLASFFLARATTNSL
jgi:hypothetical protein